MMNSEHPNAADDGLLSQVTPVVLTLNERANIGRCLARLAWAREVLVIDSFSDDGTAVLAKSFGNTRVIQREFDCHANQWNFGLSEARSAWVLALDADYVVSSEFVDEVARIRPAPATMGYRVAFRYACQGHVLRGSLYPPKVVLFRREAGTFRQDGHTQRLILNGTEAWLQGTITHDDRKSTERWLRSQWRYATLEARSLMVRGEARSALSCLRRLRFITPFLVPCYLLFLRGLILDGRAGLRYAMERMVAECLISLALAEVSNGMERNGSEGPL